MPKIEMSIRHNLPQDEALRRIRGLLADIKRERGEQISDLQERWSGNKANFSFNVVGFDVSGTLEVGSSEVKLDGNLPFLAGIFKGQIESTIRDRAQSLLA